MFQGHGESTVDIRLKRKDRTYHPNDLLEGTLVVSTTESWDCKGIILLSLRGRDTSCQHWGQFSTSETLACGSLQGSVSLSEGAAGRGLFRESPKPLALLHETITIRDAGRFPQGRTEIPFEAEVKGIDGMPLLNSYSGVYLSIGYHINAKVERGLMRKELTKMIEFMVEAPQDIPAQSGEILFEITHETLEYSTKRSGNNRRRQLKPFRVSGRLHDAAVSIGRPLTGEVVVEESECPIKSLEVQLVRVETVEQTDGQLREATEIQNLQIGDGDVCRGLAIPIYMVLPRLFSCPTIITQRFRVEFELNIIVCFADAEGYTATQNFQILLV